MKKIVLITALFACALQINAQEQVIWRDTIAISGMSRSDTVLQAPAMKANYQPDIVDIGGYKYSITVSSDSLDSQVSFAPGGSNKQIDESDPLRYGCELIDSDVWPYTWVEADEILITNYDTTYQHSFNAEEAFPFMRPSFKLFKESATIGYIYIDWLFYKP